MSTYYVRNDGTAANKSAATDPTSASTSMSLAVFNAETFSAGDNIFFSSRGGNITTGIVLPSSGSSENQITYAGEVGYIPTITSGNGVNQNSKSYVTINDLIVNGSGSGVQDFSFLGVNAVGIITNNLKGYNSGNQTFQHIDNVVVVHNNAYCEGAADDGISSHNTPSITINGLEIVNCTNGINWVDAPTLLAVYDFSITGASSTGCSIQPTNSGGVHIFERGFITEHVDATNRRIDCVYGEFTFKNIIFLNLTDGDYYLLIRSTLTGTPKIINCSFIGDGTNSCTAIFNQKVGAIYKNNYFVNAITQAFYGTAGTINYNGYYNSGTERGTNITSGNPNFSAVGKITSGSSLAINAGIGPGSDADIPIVDIDNDSRSGATCDLGADEYISIGGQPIIKRFGSIPNATINKGVW